MRRIGWVLVGSLFGLFLLAGADAGQAIHFPVYGFSIAPLEGPAGPTDSMLVTMFLPPSDGFAPNVGVISQTSTGTIDDYIATSKQDCASAGWKIIQLNKLDDHTVVFEYTGQASGKALHWYSKASLKGNEVLLVTATATEGQWAKDATQLQQCVDSFQRDSDK